MKILEGQLKKYFNEQDQTECFHMIKSIQRSITDLDLEHNISVLKRWSTKEFWNYFQKEWLHDDWVGTWTDHKRPGERVGIFNTNNACESFFKNLLRTFLGGIGNRTPSALLEIVEKNVFLYYENTFIQNVQHKATGKTTTDFQICSKDNVLWLCHKGERTKILVVQGQLRCECHWFFCKGKCIHTEFARSHPLFPPTALKNFPVLESSIFEDTSSCVELLSLNSDSEKSLLSSSSSELLSLTSSSELEESTNSETGISQKKMFILSPKKKRGPHKKVNISTKLLALSKKKREASNVESASFCSSGDSDISNTSDSELLSLTDSSDNEDVVNKKQLKKIPPKKSSTKKTNILSKLVVSKKSGRSPMIPPYLRRSRRDIKAPKHLSEFLCNL